MPVEARPVRALRPHENAAMLRSLVERIGRNVILKRRLPAEFGGASIWVSPGAGGIRYWRRDLSQIDPWLLDVVRRFVKPGYVVWDIGANVGLFSFSAAHAVGSGGSVVAVEPDTWLVELLRRSVRDNGLSDRVTVVPAAASAQLGLARFQIARRARAANCLENFGSTQTGGFVDTQHVMTITLDWLLGTLGRPPNVLKIDVEGAEIEVLEGADRLLRTARPIVFCEVLEENADRVTQILDRNGYQLFNGETPADLRMPLDRACFSTIAVPRAASSARPA